MSDIPLTHYQTDPSRSTTRDGFGEGLVESAHLHDEVVGLCADLSESTRMEWFAQAFPDRFIQVGVAEQNLAGVASGLAMAGKKPFCASYACFHPANSWGVIRSSICYSNLPVVIVGGHAGITTGPDGATHQALEDIALMRVLPNMTVVVPCDEEEARKATLALAEYPHPAYLRTSKYASVCFTVPKTPFQIGTAVTLKNGSDVTFIACGVMVEQAMLASDILADEGVSARVINMHTIKPIDADAIMHSAYETKAIITLEDHQVAGGLGSAVAEILSQRGWPAGLRYSMLGMQDSFGHSGQANELLAEYGLSVEDVVAQARALVR